MRSVLRVTSLLVILILVSFTQAEWKPAKGPLMTRWTKEVMPDKVHPEYPRPQMVRQDWLNLNGLWQLDFAKKGDVPPIGKELPEQILVPFAVESALSGVMKSAERLWYRQTFSLPEKWAGQRILLHFGAVDWEASVWVNGKNLGSHQGGYDAFSFDITDALKKEGKQEILVNVYDPSDGGTQPRGKQVRRPENIWYTPTTGIWQTVWLEPAPQASIASLRITPDVDRGEVRIRVAGHGATGNAVARATAFEGDKEVGSAAGKIGEDLVVKIPNVHLWSCDNPFLYGLKVTLSDEGTRAKDAVESYFGMRKVEIGKDEKGVTRILVNGKSVFQMGPLDQGFWPDGLYTAPTDAALKYDIEITRKLGFNMARKHVKVEPERWYYWCDKLGLFVWQDMPSGDGFSRPGQPDIVRTEESARQYERELERMIEGRFNHPSIIMWVVFNEGWGQFDVPRITALTKKLDPSRLVNSISGWNDRNVGDVRDIHSYPGPAAPEPEDKRAGVLGEFGGLGLPVDGHTWIKQTWGYRDMADKEDLTGRYERMLQRIWKLKDIKGLSAAVYTQTTDVEGEANGLLTYDREIIKMDVDRLAAINKGNFSRMTPVKTLVPTADEKGSAWMYTLDNLGWTKADYKQAADWKEGKGGFGSKGITGAVIGTEWKTNEIWLRREFTLPEGPLGEVLLNVYREQDTEIYLNGVLAADPRQPRFFFPTDYEEIPISKEARATLNPGRNVIAVHSKHTAGNRYLDVGLVEVARSAK